MIFKVFIWNYTCPKKSWIYKKLFFQIFWDRKGNSTQSENTWNLVKYLLGIRKITINRSEDAKWSKTVNFIGLKKCNKSTSSFKIECYVTLPFILFIYFMFVFTNLCINLILINLNYLENGRKIETSWESWLFTNFPPRTHCWNYIMSSGYVRCSHSASFFKVTRRTEEDIN